MDGWHAERDDDVLFVLFPSFRVVPSSGRPLVRTTTTCRAGRACKARFTELCCVHVRCKCGYDELYIAQMEGGNLGFGLWKAPSGIYVYHVESAIYIYVCIHTRTCSRMRSLHTFRSPRALLLFCSRNRSVPPFLRWRSAIAGNQPHVACVCRNIRHRSMVWFVVGVYVVRVAFAWCSRMHND